MKRPAAQSRVPERHLTLVVEQTAGFDDYVEEAPASGSFSPHSDVAQGRSHDHRFISIHAHPVLNGKLRWRDFTSSGPFANTAPSTFNDQYVVRLPDPMRKHGTPRPDWEWSVQPRPRGPLSATVISALKRQPGTLGVTPPVPQGDALTNDDLQLALYLSYELHYRSWAHPDWEWDPTLLKFRSELEHAFLLQLREEVGDLGPRRPTNVLESFDAILSGGSGPSLSSYLCEAGSADHLREVCVHRSAYQLKEADPHTFAIPRLTGEAKAAMVEIQYDEYGSGQRNAMHSELFATTMAELGLDHSYGAYVGHLPATTLATVNLISMFGLHRRWRGAAVGHLAVFEMTSVEPMARYSRALARCGVGPEGRRFYDVHVEADAQHALIARHRMIPGLLADEPYLARDVLFGAAAVTKLEENFSRHVLDSWSRDRTSLLPWGVKPRGPVPRLA